MGHDHSLARGASSKRRLAIVLALSGTYMIVEVLGGLWTGSLALLADASHMLTDVAGIALALLAIRLGERPPNTRKTYGYQRAEILAAVANSVVLLGISGYVLYEAYQRFRAPPEVQSGVMLAVAAVGLLVNGVGLLVLRGSATESLNLKGAYFEVLSDFFTSVGVLVAGLVMLMTGWYYADPIVSAGIGLFILPRTWRLLREAVDVLLEGTPRDLDLAGLRRALEQIEGVASVHDLHAWSLTSGVNAITAHLVLRPASAHESVLLAAQESLAAKFPGSHATLQLERAGSECHGAHS